jgi:hypothetical protein
MLVLEKANGKGVLGLIEILKHLLVQGWHPLSLVFERFNHI